MDNPPGQMLLADRRWMIGIGISLFFGIFGAVMTLLSYNGRDKSQAPSAAPPAASAASAPAAATAPRRHGNGRGHE